MTTHTLVASQLIARPLDEVFPFFARAQSLERITPPSMAMQLRSTDVEMRAGLEVDYELRGLPILRSTWRSRIESYDPPNGYVDIQVRGPYRRWRHAHSFTAVEGGTRVDDRVEYEMPLGPLGALAHRLLVRSQLESIFSHRMRVIESVFEPAGVAPAGVDALTVAVAGGTGFVGGGILRELRRRGHRVIALSTQGEAARGLLPDDVEIRTADAALGDGLPEGLAGVDALVIALAFRNSPMESPRTGQTFEAVDAIGTEHLVAAARGQGVKSVVYISGAGAARDARRHWFRAKWRAEEAVRASGMRWTILRPTWIYGPGDVSLNRFIGFARRLPFVPMTNMGRQKLAPVFIDDIAAAVADLLVGPAGADATFEVGGPEVLEMREIIRRAISHAGLRRPIVPGPTPLLKLAAFPLKFLAQPPLTPDGVDFVNQPAVVDTAPLRAALGRDLRTLDEGLSTYVGRFPGTATVVFD